MPEILIFFDFLRQTDRLLCAGFGVAGVFGRRGFRDRFVACRIFGKRRRGGFGVGSFAGFLFLQGLSVLVAQKDAFHEASGSEHNQRDSGGKHDFGVVDVGFLQKYVDGSTDERDRDYVQPSRQQHGPGADCEDIELIERAECHQDAEHNRHERDERVLEYQHAYAQDDGGGAGEPAERGRENSPSLASALAFSLKHEHVEHSRQYEQDAAGGHDTGRTDGSVGDYQDYACRKHQQCGEYETSTFHKNIGVKIVKRYGYRRLY